MLTEEKIRIILHFHLSGLGSTLDYSGCSPSNITNQCYHTGNSIIQIHEMTRSLLGLFTGALNTELLQDQYSGTGGHEIFSTFAFRYTYHLLFNCKNKKCFKAWELCDVLRWKTVHPASYQISLNVMYVIYLCKYKICLYHRSLWTQMTWEALFDF